MKGVRRTADGLAAKPAGSDAVGRHSFQVEGRITGKVVILACSRCLAATECPLRNTFRLTFARRIPGDAADLPPEDRELQAEELGVVLFEGDQIDFRDIIQEQVILAIPMQPICRQDCRGTVRWSGAAGRT